MKCELIFYLAGRTGQLEELQEMVKRYHLEKQVIFTDKKLPEEVPAYYACADCFVSASLTETQGMTYIEALACGLPVFARYDDVLKDLVIEEDSGFLFVKNNGAPIHPDSFAGWLRKFTKRHNLPHLHPHGFRHTNASMLIGNGVDVVTVANRLGHADVSTTLDIYSHAINEAKAKASETLADVMLRRKKA